MDAFQTSGTSPTPPEIAEPSTSDPLNTYTTREELAEQRSEAVQHPAYTMSFKQRAVTVALKNVPITPVQPESKSAFLPDWPTSATKDVKQIELWDQIYPGFNYAAVATGQPDGVWFFEVDSREVFDRILTDTGHDLIAEVPTFLVRSRVGRGHVYFRNTSAALAMGNLSQSHVKHGDFSVRVRNMYCVGPYSIHPTSKQPYLPLNPDADILPAPDWLVEWLIRQKVETIVAGRPDIPFDPAGLIPHGYIHGWMVTQAGKLRQMGLSVDSIETALLDLVHRNCAPPIDETKVRQVARSFDKYERGMNTDLIMSEYAKQQAEAESQIEFVDVFDPKTAEVWQKADMSADVMSGRLGELCQRIMLKHFPVAYAWPSVIAVAGVMVPTMPVQEGAFIKQQDVMTNSYTGLVGPVHSGKSQAILWATKVIGLPEGYYTDVKAGSSEGLLKKLAQMRNSGKLQPNVLIDLDEWQHFFSKAGIENSSFTSFLHTAFYKRRQNVIISRGKELDVDCALSFIGGIVEDEFDTCFGVNSMGGLHDRFTFGLCPQGFNFIYRPFEGNREVLNPVPTTVHPEIWEMVETIRKESPNIGREAEIAVRSAVVCASFDGVRLLEAKNAERMVRAMIAEQSKIRDYLRPNGGVTSDAQCSNALVSWLIRNAGDGKLVWERDIRHGLRKTLERFGPGALEYSTRNLAKQGVIWHGELATGKRYKGRLPRAYRLIDASGFTGATYK